MSDAKIIAALKAAGLYKGLAEAVEKDMTVSEVHVTTALGNEAKVQDEKKPPEKKPDDPAKDGKGDFVTKVFVAKMDPEKRQVFGWASVSKIGGKLVIDKQGDVIPVEEIENAAYDFVLFSREQGDMHEKRGVGKMIESCVFTEEKARLCGISAVNDKNQPMEGWWVGFQVDSDQVWEAHKSGGRPEFSIGGTSGETEAVEP